MGVGWMEFSGAISFWRSTPDTGAGNEATGLLGKTPGRCHDVVVVVVVVVNELLGKAGAMDTGADLDEEDRDDLAGFPASAAAWPAFNSSLLWMREWRCMLPLVVKDMWHTLHLKGRSPGNNSR